MQRLQIRHDMTRRARPCWRGAGDRGDVETPGEETLDHDTAEAARAADHDGVTGAHCSMSAASTRSAKEGQ